MRKMYRLVASLLSLCLLLGVAGCVRPGAKPRPVALYPAYVVEDGNQRWGFINDKGKFAIAPAYQWTSDFGTNGLAVVEANDRYGVINAKGKLVETPAYTDIYVDTASGAMIARNGDQYKVLGQDSAVWFTSADSVRAFADGLAPFSVAAGETPLWGYVKPDGKVAIEPQYHHASPFVDGKAVVRMEDGAYGLIDTTGKLLQTFAYAFVGDLSEDLLTFRDEESGRFGYVSLTGQVVIPAQFVNADAFHDGLAVVGLHSDSGPRYGLIDKQGKMALAAQYSSLRPIGGGLYAAGEPGDYYTPDEFVPKALVDQTGDHLTEFRFYDIGQLTDGVISVTDFSSTFFVDATGQTKTDLPRLRGIGEAKVAGAIVEAQIDGEPLYVTKDGKTIWEPDHTQKLAGDITVTTLKRRPNRMLLVRYPEIYGPPGNAHDELNRLIRVAFIGEGPYDNDPGTPEEYTESVTVGFSIERLGNLLVVHQDGYVYPIGAAHGMPIDSYYHFDLSTSKAYTIEDLFRKDSQFGPRLTALIKEQMAAEPEPYWFEGAEPTIRPEHPFTVTADGLIVCFTPYEIAPYAAGSPAFEIPWTQIEDIVDKEGAFWRSFH